METNDKKVSQKSSASIVLYVAAGVVALIGIALLILDIIQYNSQLKQYVAQGYTAAQVASQLIPNQLIPAILQSLGIYEGIAVVLAGVGIANAKASKCLALLNETHASSCNEIVEESNLEHDAVAPETATDEQQETAEAVEQTESTEEVNK